MSTWKKGTASVRVRCSLKKISKRLIRKGRQALRQKNYSTARECFEEAMVLYPIYPDPNRSIYALSCLFTGDLDEAYDQFEQLADNSENAFETVRARIMTDWIEMCYYPSKQEYLTWLQELYGWESEQNVLEMLEVVEGNDGQSSPETMLHAAILYFLQGDSEKCLQTLVNVTVVDHAFFPWCCSFWQAISYATLGNEEQATEQVHNALIHGLPPILMGPLRWLIPRDANPTSWYMRVVEPLF